MEWEGREGGDLLQVITELLIYIKTIKLFFALTYDVRTEFINLVWKNS